MERLRILVLFGGCSSEHEVSLQSAHGVLTHMDPERYCPIPVGITREGVVCLQGRWTPSPMEGGSGRRGACPAPCGWTGEPGPGAVGRLRPGGGL